MSVAANFFVTLRRHTKATPPFSFDDEFTSLRTLSASLADIRVESAGATVRLNSGALSLTGPDAGLNVFTVSAAQITQAPGVAITLTKAGATALINVTPTPSSRSPSST